MFVLCSGVLGQNVEELFNYNTKALGTKEPFLTVLSESSLEAKSFKKK